MNNLVARAWHLYCELGIERHRALRRHEFERADRLDKLIQKAIARYQRRCKLSEEGQNKKASSAAARALGQVGARWMSR